MTRKTKSWFKDVCSVSLILLPLLSRCLRGRREIDWKPPVNNTKWKVSLFWAEVHTRRDNEWREAGLIAISSRIALSSANNSAVRNQGYLLGLWDGFNGQISSYHYLTFCFFNQMFIEVQCAHREVRRRAWWRRFHRWPHLRKQCAQHETECCQPYWAKAPTTTNF